MKRGKIVLLACLTVGLARMELCAQAAPQEQTPGPGTTTTTSEPSSPPTDKPKQPAGEPGKPGQGATADQTPSPLPQTNPPQTPENAPEAQPTSESAPPAQAKAPAAASKKKKAAKAGTATKPQKRVIRDGGADDVDVQISEGMPNDVAVHQRASTDTLLSSTEANLKRISGRTLTAQQQTTVNQIRLFMQESRDAIHKSDVDRAHTLALKAHLLSRSLLKQ